MKSDECTGDRKVGGEFEEFAKRRAATGDDTWAGYL